MGAAVWETSHTGGHRFAASVLTFPHGGVHGRVTDPGAFAEAVGAGRIDLATYRGNAGLRRPAQAAEVALRLQAALARPDDVTIDDCTVEGDVATVAATTPAGPRRVVVRQRSLPPRPTSCGGAPKAVHPWIVTSIDDHPVAPRDPAAP